MSSPLCLVCRATPPLNSDRDFTGPSKATWAELPTKMRDLAKELAGWLIITSPQLPDEFDQKLNQKLIQILRRKVCTRDCFC